MKILGKYLRNLLIVLLTPFIIYLGLVLFGGIILVNKKSKTSGPITIYLVQNGAHTDIVTPIKNEIIDWEKIIPMEHFPTEIKNARYYSFGWGDREFYKTTPYWEDLQFKTAVKSLFINTEPAMHIYRLTEIQAEKVVAVQVGKEQYKRLSEYILKHLQINKSPFKPLEFNCSKNDVFYTSASSFHAFRTCNTWANSALKYSGLRSCLWTPFSWPIFWQYP